jgi:hypothetical protein
VWLQGLSAGKLLLCIHHFLIGKKGSSLADLQYWNWFDNSDFAKSPVFDGSATSMGGDGAFVAHNGAVSGFNNIFIPSGNGGGCVKDGPFVK